MNPDFEIFAKEFAQYFLQNYMIPWMKQHGVVQSYRAVIEGKDDPAQGVPIGYMSVKKPIEDTEILVPYAESAAGLEAGDYCIVLYLGDMSNSVIISDSEFNLFRGIILIGEPNQFVGETTL